MVLTSSRFKDWHCPTIKRYRKVAHWPASISSMVNALLVWGGSLGPHLVTYLLWISFLQSLVSCLIFSSKRTEPTSQCLATSSISIQLLLSALEVTSRELVTELPSAACSALHISCLAIRDCHSVHWSKLHLTIYKPLSWFPSPFVFSSLASEHGTAELIFLYTHLLTDSRSSESDFWSCFIFLNFSWFGSW